MQSTTMVTGRRLLVALEPGDEVLTSLAEACRQHAVRQAVIVTFSGALRDARIIATDRPVADPEAPLPESVEVAYTEGIGSGTVSSTDDGELVVHVHVALGVKDRSGAAVAGHLLHARTHYVVEVVLDEVLAPVLRRAPHPGSSGVPILAFDPLPTPEGTIRP